MARDVVYSCDKCEKPIKSNHPTGVKGVFETKDGRSKRFSFHLCKTCMGRYVNPLLKDLSPETLK